VLEPTKGYKQLTRGRLIPIHNRLKTQQLDHAKQQYKQTPVNCHWTNSTTLPISSDLLQQLKLPVSFYISLATLPSLCERGMNPVVRWYVR